MNELDGQRTICGFSGNVETCRVPLRRSVGATNAGRIERADRANVVDSIMVAIDISSVDVVLMLQINC